MECHTEPEIPTVIILDDVMSSINNSKKLEELFTRGVHHRKVSVILTLQNLFYQGSVMKTLRDNSMYIALTRHIQDVSKLDTFARQLERKNSNYFKNSYDDAVSEKYGYLFCDLHPHSDLRDGPFKIKYRSSIHKTEGQVLYLPDGKKAIVEAGGEKAIVEYGKTTLNIPFSNPTRVSASPTNPKVSNLVEAENKVNDILTHNGDPALQSMLHNDALVQFLRYAFLERNKEPGPPAAQTASASINTSVNTPVNNDCVNIPEVLQANKKHWLKKKDLF